MEQLRIHLNVGQPLIQHHVRLEQVLLTLLEHVIVVMRFLKHIHVHQEHYLVHLVFRLLLRIGNVHHDIVYMALRVREALISSHIAVRMEEHYLVLHV